ncbi:hypothetical protein AGMMS49579_26640 [Spirochaetia bacterium]|nr:hypothetical protein AGMMS49579_26640 [Spirochaetia bacterium]
MKNFFKLFGLIAIVAMIGIGLAGCDPEEEPTSGTVTFTLAKASANSFTITVDGADWHTDDYVYARGLLDFNSYTLLDNNSLAVDS